MKTWWEWPRQATDGRLTTPIGGLMGATGRLTAPGDAAMLVLIKDGAFFGRRQFDMGNVA